MYATLLSKSVLLQYTLPSSAGTTKRYLHVAMVSVYNRTNQPEDAKVPVGYMKY